MKMYEDEKEFLKNLITEKAKSGEDVTMLVRILGIVKECEKLSKKQKANDDLSETITRAVLQSLTSPDSQAGKDLRYFIEHEGTQAALRAFEVEV